MMEREPDLIFVKEEMYDDYPIGQQRSLTDNRKSKCILKRNQTQVIILSCVCIGL